MQIGFCGSFHFREILLESAGVHASLHCTVQ